MNKTARLISLDVFRGATIAFMILVNNQGISGNAYGPLAHGSGYAITPTDWVFPFFLFIVGVAMPFSFAGRLRFIYEHWLLPLMSKANASLVFGLCHVLLWWGVLAFMYRRKWFVKI